VFIKRRSDDYADGYEYINLALARSINVGPLPYGNGGDMIGHAVFPALNGREHLIVFGMHEDQAVMMLTWLNCESVELFSLTVNGMEWHV